MGTSEEFISLALCSRSLLLLRYTFVAVACVVVIALPIKAPFTTRIGTYNIEFRYIRRSACTVSCITWRVTIHSHVRISTWLMPLQHECMVEEKVQIHVRMIQSMLRRPSVNTLV